MSKVGHNSNAILGEFEARADVICADAEGLAKAGISGNSQSKARSLKEDCAKLWKDAEAERKVQKEPHMAAAKAVDEAFKPVMDRVEQAGKALGAAITRYLEVEESKNRAAAAEAARIAQKESRKAMEAQRAAQASADPFEAFDASEADAKANAAQDQALRAAQSTRATLTSDDTARAMALKVTGYDVTVTDAAALVAHFAAHPDVIEAARKAAASQARATNGAVSIPGVTITPIRKAV